VFARYVETLLRPRAKSVGGGLILAMVLVVSSGCVTTPPREGSAVEWLVPAATAYPPELRSAVTRFWEQIARGEWSRCFEMETPENRDRIPESLYEAYYKGGWKISGPIEILDVQETGPEKLKVSIRMKRIDPRNGNERVVFLHDVWHKGTRVWFHNLNDPLVPLEGKGR